MRYKFRAETLRDACLFLDDLQRAGAFATRVRIERMRRKATLSASERRQGYSICPGVKFFWMPDVEVVFSCRAEVTEQNLTVMVFRAASLPDCHVIAETLQPISLYTSKRTYGRGKKQVQRAAALVRSEARRLEARRRA